MVGERLNPQALGSELRLSQGLQPTSRTCPPYLVPYASPPPTSSPLSGSKLFCGPEYLYNYAGVNQSSISSAIPMKNPSLLCGLHRLLDRASLWRTTSHEWTKRVVVFSSRPLSFGKRRLPERVFAAVASE